MLRALENEIIKSRCHVLFSETVSLYSEKRYKTRFQLLCVFGGNLMAFFSFYNHREHVHIFMAWDLRINLPPFEATDPTVFLDVCFFLYCIFSEYDLLGGWNKKV